MITYHLADSMPAAVLARWNEELASLTLEAAEYERRKRIEAYLDTGKGACWLKQDEIAAVVEGALLFFDNERYRLHAWVIMPNHVHYLLTPFPDRSLSNIIFSQKSYTANQANRILRHTGQFWFEDYFDRYIRDEQHFQAAVNYIEANPMKAGLCKSPEEWRWSSAWRRGTGGQDDRAPR